MAKYDPGRLNRQITLQSFTTTQNDYNEDVPSWSTYATVWAALFYQRAEEITAAGGERGRQFIEFVIRYRSDVTASDRIVYNSENYEIVARQEVVGRDHYLKLIGRVIE